MPRKKSTPSKKPSKKSVRSSLVLSLVVAFILFSLIGVYTNTPEQLTEVTKNVLSQVSEQKIDQEKPKLVTGAVKPENLSARGVYAFDLDSGETLFEKEKDNPVLPASTTKLATALVSLKDYKLDDVVTVKNVSQIAGNKMGLISGEKITVKDLLYGLLIYSANDAAYALADHHSQGRPGFINRMNEVTEDLGLTKSHFTNPAGFDEYLHFSTANDMAKLANLAILDPNISEIVKIQSFQVSSTDGRINHKLTNTNHLLGKVDGVIGIKTGTTITSGESLITLVDRDGKRIILSVLGSQDRFGETEKLIDWIFSNYNWGQL